MFLSPTFVLSLKFKRLRLAKKAIKDCSSSNKTEGEPKGVSINSFCINNNIPYTNSMNGFKKTQKKIVPVEVKVFMKN